MEKDLADRLIRKGIAQQDPDLERMACDALATPMAATAAAIQVVEALIHSDSNGAAAVLAKHLPDSHHFIYGGDSYNYSTLGIINAILDTLGEHRVAIIFDASTQQPLGVEAYGPKGNDDERQSNSGIDSPSDEPNTDQSG